MLKKAKEQTALAQKKYKKIQRISEKEIKIISKQNLKFIGLALYWGEGYKKLKKVGSVVKTSHPLSLSNSDPHLIEWYIQFLEKVCQVPRDKMKASIRYYEHQNYHKILKYWRNTTKLPLNQFTKPYKGVSKASLGKKPKNALPYGTIRIDVYDSQLFYRVMGWINGIKSYKG